MGWGRIQTSFFAIRYSVFLQQFVEETLSPLNGHHTPQKSLPVDVWVYSWTLNPISLIYISILKPVPYCFDYCSFIVSFEIKKNESSNLVLFLDLFRLFAALCNSMWILESSCLFMQKGLSDFDRDDSESIDCLLNITIWMILSLWIHEPRMFFHLFRSYFLSAIFSM